MIILLLLGLINMKSTILWVDQPPQRMLIEGLRTMNMPKRGLALRFLVPQFLVIQSILRDTQPMVELVINFCYNPIRSLQSSNNQ